MRFIKPTRCPFPIATSILASVWISFIAGCQSESSDPNPLVVTPIDTTRDKASLTLLTPEVGDSYKLGDSLHVTATVEDNDKGTIDSVDVFLSPDGGNTWGAISDRSHPVDRNVTFTFSWKIPAYFKAGGKSFLLAQNSNCMIRIAHKGTLDSLKITTSVKFQIEDTVFLRLTYPLGGETFRVGDTARITWITKFDDNLPVEAVDVKISPDSGKTWANFRASSITTNDPGWRRFPWIVTDSITIRGQKLNIVGNPGVCIRVEEYTSMDPKTRFQSGMISIIRP